MMNTSLTPLIARAKAVDLPALAGRYTSLRRWSRTEYAGPCPFCGGRDRFHVQAQRWLCHKCTQGRWTDAIAFERKRTGAGFRETVLALADCAPETLTLVDAPAPYTDEPPCERWQRRAQTVLDYAQRALWKPAGARWRAWLYERGLTAETMRFARLGCIAERRYEPPEWWGVPSDGKRSDVWLAAGLVIPCITDRVLWYLTVRRWDVTRGKYVRVRGHRPGLYLGDTARSTQVVVITEGELDALLVWQETRQLNIGVATLGSATGRLRGRWSAWLAGQRMLLGFDADEAGRHAEALWLEAYPSAIPLRWPIGKDLTAYRQRGGDLAALVQAQL